MYDFVLFCLVVSMRFLPAVCSIGESGMGPAPALFYFHFYFSAANPSRWFSLGLFTSFLFLFDCCPPFPPPSFLFRCVAHSLSLSSYRGCLALLIWLPFLPNAYYMWWSFIYFALFVFCFLVFPPESLPGDDVLAGYFHVRFLISAFFPVCLFCFVFLRPSSLPVCFM